MLLVDVLKLPNIQNEYERGRCNVSTYKEKSWVTENPSMHFNAIFLFAQYYLLTVFAISQALKIPYEFQTLRPT